MHFQGIFPQPEVNLEPIPFGYVPQHGPGPIPTAVPPPFVYEKPTPNQAEAESLRRLAIRYLHHPGAQVGTGAGSAGGYKVVIILQTVSNRLIFSEAGLCLGVAFSVRTSLEYHCSTTSRKALTLKPMRVFGRS